MEGKPKRKYTRRQIFPVSVEVRYKGGRSTVKIGCWNVREQDGFLRCIVSQTEAEWVRLDAVQSLSIIGVPQKVFENVTEVESVSVPALLPPPQEYKVDRAAAMRELAQNTGRRVQKRVNLGTTEKIMGASIIKNPDGEGEIVVDATVT